MLRFVCWVFIICLVSPVHSHAWFMMVAGSTVPSISWIFHSDFEDTTDRAQWNVEAGTPNFDHSSTGLSMTGSYVMRLDAGNQVYGGTAYDPDKDELCVVFQARYEDTMEANEYNLKFRDGASSNVCQAEFQTDGDIAAVGVGASGNVVTASFDADETAWFRGYYKKGTGANAICSISIWNGSSWDESITTAATSTTAVDRIRFQNGQDGTGVEYWYFDEVTIFETKFEGNPTTL